MELRSRAAALAMVVAAGLAAAPIADACRVRRTTVKLSPVPDACHDGAFQVTAAAGGTRPLTKLVLELDGKRVAQSGSRRVAARIDCRRLRPGEHRLTAKAYLAAGSVSRSDAEFSRAP